MKFRIREVAGLDRKVFGRGAVALAFGAVATDAPSHAQEDGFALRQDFRGRFNGGLTLLALAK